VARLRSSEAGESLTEVVLGTVIFLVLAGALAGMLTGAISAHRNARGRTAAEQAAEDQIESIRRLPYKCIGTTNGNPAPDSSCTSSQIPTTTKTLSGTVIGVPATLTTKITYVDDAAPTSYRSKADYKKIVVTVARQNDGKVLTTQTTFVRPTSVPCKVNNSIISAQVIDMGNNTPVPDMGVALATGPSAPTGDTTDTSGTVTFTCLTSNPTSGSTAYYDINLTPPSGYTELKDDVSPNSASHVQLSPSQEFDTVLRIYRAPTIVIDFKNSNGTEYTGTTATYTIGSSRGSVTATYPGSPVTLTSIAGEPIVPGLQYTATTAGGFLSTQVQQYVPPNYPTDMTSTFVMSSRGNGSIQATVTWGGLPVSGATVTVTGGPLSVNQTLTTNSSGVATFPSLTSGSGYTVTATYSGQTATATSQTVTNNQTLAVPLSFATGSFAATATWGTGAAVPGAKITVTGGPMSVNLGPYTADSSGKYTVTNLPAGSGYTIVGLDSSTSLGRTLTNQTAVANSTTSISLQFPVGTITATVTWGGTAISGATVSVTGGPTTIASQTTNTSGVATFTNVPTVSGYTITATYSGQTASVTGQTVTNGGTLSVPLSFPGGTVAVTVTWAGAANPGATVTLTGGPVTIASQTTNSSGLATFTNVPATSGYTVTATENGQSASVSSQTVVANQTTNISLAMPTGSVAATVTWNGAALTKSTSVTLSGGPMGISTTATTNTSGQVTFTNVPAVGVGYTGYTLTASNITSSSFTVAASPTVTSKTVDLPNETLTVTVKNTSNVLQGGATVNVTGGPLNGFSLSATTSSSTYSPTVSGTSGLVNYWRLGETATPSAFSSDTFTGSSGTTLASHTGEVGGTWTQYTGAGTTPALLTDANRVRKSATTGYAAYYSSGVPASADYTVQADVVVKSILSQDSAGVIGRASTAAQTYYVARYNTSQTRWELAKVVSGTTTVLGSSSQTLTVGATYTVRLEMLGSALRVYVNGASVITASDSSITAAGRAGIQLGYSGAGSSPSNTTGLHLDNFVGNSTAQAADSKGTNTGTYVNGVNQIASGAIAGDSNDAATFDGSNDYINVARQISDDFSIEFWFASSQGLNTNSQWWGNAGLVDGEVGGSTNDFGVSLRSDGKITAGTGNPDTTIISPSSYNNNAWHYVVFTRQKSTGALKLYVDGSLVATGTSTNVGSLTAPSFLNIGRIQTGTYYYSGYMDEIALYNVVLGSSTVTSHYNAGLGAGVGVVTFTVPSGTSYTATATSGTKTGTWTGNVTSSTSATVTVQ